MTKEREREREERERERERERAYLRASRPRVSLSSVQSAEALGKERQVSERDRCWRPEDPNRRVCCCRGDDHSLCVL